MKECPWCHNPLDELEDSWRHRDPNKYKCWYVEFKNTTVASTPKYSSYKRYKIDTKKKPKIINEYIQEEIKLK